MGLRCNEPASFKCEDRPLCAMRQWRQAPDRMSGPIAVLALAASRSRALGVVRSGPKESDNARFEELRSEFEQTGGRREQALCWLGTFQKAIRVRRNGSPLQRPPY